MQVLTSMAPSLLSLVDCVGDEERLIDCDANTAANQACNNDDNAVNNRRGIVLACSNTVEGMHYPHWSG